MRSEWKYAAPSPRAQAAPISLWLQPCFLVGKRREESYGSASWDYFHLSSLIPPPSHGRKKFRLGHRCRRKYAADATRADQRQPFDSLHAFTLPVSKTLHCFFIIGARGNNKGSCCIQVINWLSHFSPCGESCQVCCSLNCWWENVGGVLETSHATLRN